jgi:hypothetical protein
MASYFQSAPFEVIDHILSLTNPETVSSVSQTSRVLHAYIRDNAFLWKSLFAKYFDLPEEHNQPISWRLQVQSRIRAKHTILAFFSAHVSGEELENAFKTFIQIVRSAPPGRGRSKNTTWLDGILKNPALWPSQSPLTSAHPRLDQNSQTQSELQVLECDRIGGPGDRFKARTFVYDMRNYRHTSLYGPFIPRASQNETLRINYLHLRYLMNVLLNNLRDSHSEDVHVWMQRGFESSRPMTAPPSTIDGDWAGVQGDWLRFVSWAGYEELEEYNVRHAQPSISGALSSSSRHSGQMADCQTTRTNWTRVSSVNRGLSRDTRSTTSPCALYRLIRRPDAIQRGDQRFISREIPLEEVQTKSEYEARCTMREET